MCLPNFSLVDGRFKYQDQVLEIGKVRLYSSVDESEIFDEIRSVINLPMYRKEDFNFTILQPAEGSKSLINTQQVQKLKNTDIYLGS